MLGYQQFRGNGPRFCVLPSTEKLTIALLSCTNAYLDRNLYVKQPSQMEHVGKEGGHEQMLSQAAAVLVSLSTLVTLEITGVGLLAVFNEMLSFAGSANTRFFEDILVVFVIHIIILIIFDCTLSTVRFPARRQSDFVAWQACRW